MIAKKGMLLSSDCWLLAWLLVVDCWLLTACYLYVGYGLRIAYCRCRLWSTVCGL